PATESVTRPSAAAEPAAAPAEAAVAKAPERATATERAAVRRTSAAGRVPFRQRGLVHLDGKLLPDLAVALVDHVLQRLEPHRVQLGHISLDRLHEVVSIGAIDVVVVPAPRSGEAALMNGGHRQPVALGEALVVDGRIERDDEIHAAVIDL